MTLLDQFRKTKSSAVEAAAAALARGDEVNAADLLTEADVAAVEARADELRRVADLQPLAAKVDALADKLTTATEWLARERERWRDGYLGAQRDRTGCTPAPTMPDHGPRRKLKQQLAEAEQALRELLALVPEDVASDWIAADRAHQVAQAEANQAARRQRDVNTQRARLEHRLKLTEQNDRSRGALDMSGERAAAQIRAQLGELPSEADLTKAAKAAAKRLKPAATARTKTLKAVTTWKP